MTLEEVCKKYEVSESSVKNMFPRTQKSILKKYGVQIVKEGWGKSASYRELPHNDGRARTMFLEDKEKLMINQDELSLVNWSFSVFLAIVTTPMLVFRGSNEDFLNYMGLKPSESNVKLLIDSLKDLNKRDIITYIIDKTDENYFVAALYRKVEKEMNIGIEMVRTCKELAEEYNKRSWVSLLKVWLGIQMIVEEDLLPFTIAELGAYTGLSEYQVRESKRILETNDIFRTSRAYESFSKCIGQNVDLNKFYNE